MKEFIEYLVKTWGASGWKVCDNNKISIYYNNSVYFLRVYKNDNDWYDVIEFESISIEEFLNKYRGDEFYIAKSFEWIKTTDLLEWHILKSIN